ncbi:glycosyltransferase family 39 protein [Oryzomonas japonica]|uniref:Glycosyltransferase family 39 protein n=1 Tax=Oryzomonas japonica TaxID=2603858 RepID=A0A7J4ZN59_9BACT|nr:glycosyltransferase family 39 protein [Oryzomonas japonica]KAB0664235.1 glycosyltransferase family 39 protein [Oryzomonas japonica]
MKELCRLLQDRWDLICALGICLLAFAIRYHFIITYQHPMMIHEQDAIGYMEIAKRIVQLQPLYVSGRPPGYPIIISFFSLLPIELEYAARLASIFMDACIVFPLYFLARSYFPRLLALAVCLLWTFFSFSLYFSTSPLSQSSYLLYLLSAIVFLKNGLDKKNIQWLFGAGILFSLSFLARPEGIAGFACGFTMCLIPLLNRENIKNIKIFFLPISILFGFMLLTGPYLIAFHNETGYWGITAKSEAALKGQDGVVKLDSKGELEKNKPGVSVWKEYYGTLPNFINAIKDNIKAYYNVYYRTFPPWMHIISLIGIIALLWGRRATNVPYILILLAVTAPNYIVNVSKSHSYLYSVFPVFFVCFIAGMEVFAKLTKYIIDKLKLLTKPTFNKAVIEFIIIIIISYISFESYKLADNSYQGLIYEAHKTEKIFKEPGEFIKLNSSKNEIIMTRWGLVGYFADRPVVTLPKGGVKEVIDYGRKHGVHFLLIDTESVLSRRQELMELLDPLGNKSINPEYGIEVVTRNLYPDIGGYVVYRYRI